MRSNKPSAQEIASIVKGAVVASTTILEKVAPAVGYDLEGLTNMTTNPNNKEMSDIIKELECKYCYGYNGMGPEVKFLFHMGIACYQLDSFNKQRKKDQLVQTPVNQAVQTQYKDL